MKRNARIAAALTVAAATSIGTATQAEAVKETVVLVHGAFADGSSWNKVIPILRENGLDTIAVQLPLSSLAEDVAFTKRAIKEAKGDVILVGHSWGGVVITEAGADEAVSSLVYLSAFAPEQGEHIHDILDDAHGAKGIPHVPGLANPIADDEAYLRLSEDDIVNYFAPDIEEGDARLIAAGQGRLHAATLDQAPRAQAWEEKPSWYVVTADDQMLAPDTQRLMATRIGAKVTELPASHVSMLSMPEKVADVILEASK